MKTKEKLHLMDEIRRKNDKSWRINAMTENKEDSNMKKITYIVTHERFNGNQYGIPGVTIREKNSGELNRFFPAEFKCDGKLELIPFDVLLHIQSLVNDYGAHIEWDLVDYPD